MGRSRTRYVQKSCTNCRKEKRRCSEGIICKRCSDRGRECKRNWDSQKRGRKKNNTDGNSGNNMTDEAIFILGDNNPLAIPPVTEENEQSSVYKNSRLDLPKKKKQCFVSSILRIQLIEADYEKERVL
ncbi:19839_t:CDS:2 [Entrophospora sp. SA101]|nr:19839_t:CDS:2 [Entrophospora sp. SA101]